MPLLMTHICVYLLKFHYNYIQLLMAKVIVPMYTTCILWVQMHSVKVVKCTCAVVLAYQWGDKNFRIQISNIRKSKGE